MSIWPEKKPNFLLKKAKNLFQSKIIIFLFITQINTFSIISSFFAFSVFVSAAAVASGSQTTSQTPSTLSTSKSTSTLSTSKSTSTLSTSKSTSTSTLSTMFSSTTSSTTTTSLNVMIDLKPDFLSLVANGDEVSVFEAMKQMAFLQSNPPVLINPQSIGLNTKPTQMSANAKTLCIYLGKSIQNKPKNFLWALRKYRKDIKDPSCPLTYLGPSYNGNLKGRRAILQLRIEAIKKVSTRELSGVKSESLNILRAAFRSTPPVE